MKKIIFGILLSSFFVACNNEKKDDKAATDGSTTIATSDKKIADEMLDKSEGEEVKNSWAAFSRGDIDGMSANYDDNIHYLWSNGDSLVGKKAVQDYYKGRWKLIDSINYSEHILMPIKMNVSQSKFAPLGKWVLYWTLVHVKYKNGKKLDFWSHTVNHYSDAGKIDFIGQYLDRHPIIEATKDLMK